MRPVLLLCCCCLLLQAADTLKSAGCKTEYFVIKALAEQANTQGLKVQVGKTGNKKAIALLVNGKIDFAFTCKPGAALAKKFKVDASVAVGWTTVPIAKDPIVLVANSGVGVSDLSMEQIKNIFSGSITNWSAVGGPDMVIAVGYLDASVESGTVTVFKETTIGATATLVAATKALPAPNALGNYAKGTPGALVVMGLNSYQSDHGTLLTIDGVSADRSTILDGSYPLAVTYNLVYPTADAERLKPWLDLVSSPDGQQAIDSLAVSIKP